MKDLEPVFSGSDLKQGAVYQIKGTLYRYLYKDVYRSPEYPLYKFQILPGQRKRTDISLNKNSIRSAYLVPGCKAQQVSSVSSHHIQLSLF